MSRIDTNAVTCWVDLPPHYRDFYWQCVRAGDGDEVALDQAKRAWRFDAEAGDRQATEAAEAERRQGKLF